MRSCFGIFCASLLTSAAADPNSAPTRPAFDANSDTTVYALSIVFACTFLLTFYVGVLYFRERKRIRMARALAAAPGPEATGEHLEPEVWKQRALSAEALANNQALLLREKLLPELSDFVKQSLVQGLTAQRDALLAMQQQALHHLAEMETRLSSLQAPLQDRIRAYENRIAELEKEISSQHNEVRELTRTILQLMRKKLDEEQAQTLANFD